MFSILKRTNSDGLTVEWAEKQFFHVNFPNEILEKKWIILGNIYSRQFGQKNNKPLSEIELTKLFKLHGDSFINSIKGNFILVQFLKDGCKIYSDRFAIKKYFIWNNCSDFVISDQLHTIAKYVTLEPSPEAMGIYALTYHFTGGKTLFKNVFHNLPGQILTITDGQLKEDYYWKPEQLFNIPKKNTGINEVSNALSNAVHQSLTQTVSKNISLSLTGGADTRNLLAIFLRLGIKPHLYTYGNPLADDCVKASGIAKGLGLEHSIYDIQMDAGLFENYARKIIASSGGLASIHRAHRLMAVEKEKQYASSMFLGTLGGEFIKGVSLGDYIVPAIVYENWYEQQLTNAHIVKHADKKFLKLNNINLDYIASFLQKEPYFNGVEPLRKLNSLSFITAHLHDAQDVNLYKTVMNEVYTPFLDIDYLEVLFSSAYSFEVKQEIRNKYLRLIENPVYASQFIKATYPPLLKFTYAGNHRPDEVLLNKYYAAVMKVVRKKISKKAPPTFPLNSWMEDFVKKHLPACKDYKVIDDTFNLDSLLNELFNENHQPNETYWLKFTNPIMMRFIIEEYTQ